MHTNDQHFQRTMGRREGGLWMFIAGSLLAAAGYAVEPSAVRAQDDAGEGPISMTVPVMGNADSNHRMVAVTGVDITGNNVLYVIDTIDMQIAVYQANGGSKGTRSITLVAARNISLDLKLSGFNDKSEYDYDALHEQFRRKGLVDD